MREVGVGARVPTGHLEQIIKLALSFVNFLHDTAREKRSGPLRLDRGREKTMAVDDGNGDRDGQCSLFCS